MDDVIVWIIIAAFYAPLHFAAPVGLVILTVPDPQGRRRLIRVALIESAVSMMIAFALVIWLAQKQMGLAMAILFFSMLVPFVLLWVHRRLDAR